MLFFLISDAGKDTLGGGEEKLNDLFTYKEGDEVTYFVSEGLGDQKLDVGPSGGVLLFLERVRLPPRNINLKTKRFWRSLKKEDRLLSHLPRNQLLGRLLLRPLLPRVLRPLKVYWKMWR